MKDFYESILQYIIRIIVTQNNIPNMIERDENIEYIQFSVPNAVIPVSFFIIHNTNCQLDLIENGVAATYKFEYVLSS